MIGIEWNVSTPCLCWWCKYIEWKHHKHYKENHRSSVTG